MSVRKIDYICRYGGDEFIVLMPETNNREAQIIKERIEKTIKNLADEVSVLYSVSIGLYTGRNEGKEEIFDKADIDLYRMKSRRRKHKMEFSPF